MCSKLKCALLLVTNMLSSKSSGCRLHENLVHAFVHVQHQLAALDSKALSQQHAPTATLCHSGHVSEHLIFFAAEKMTIMYALLRMQEQESIAVCAPMRKEYAQICSSCHDA